MTYKEEVKKLRLKMLMTQEEFAKLLDVSFATINRWKMVNMFQLLKQEENYNHILKSIILRWMNNGDCKPSYINSFFICYNRYIFCNLFFRTT